MKDPPPYPCRPASVLLETIAQAYPKLFYKPIFTCATATKDATLVHQLRIIAILGRYMPNFWTHDLDMLKTALMSDPGATKPPDTSTGAKPWGKPRIGQLVLFTELIAYVREVAKEREEKVVGLYIPVRRSCLKLDLLCIDTRQCLASSCQLLPQSGV